MSLVGPNPQPWAHPAPDLETLQLDNFTGLRNKAESRMLFWDSGFGIQDSGFRIPQIYLCLFHPSFDTDFLQVYILLLESLANNSSTLLYLIILQRAA